MEKLNNWAYGFVLNHEGAGVGTIYYAENGEVTNTNNVLLAKAMESLLTKK